MQQAELEKLDLVKLRKKGFLGIDPFNYPLWETLPKEEVNALSLYGEKEPVLKDFPVKHIVAPNLNNLVFSIGQLQGKFIPWFYYLEK